MKLCLQVQRQQLRSLRFDNRHILRNDDILEGADFRCSLSGRPMPLPRFQTTAQ
jgi:hypothetical protein